ncbi:DUF1156 domain-containing protein [Halosegnis marinus]|uniref:DUF1156 domain-containing protein n=2 Tax=Halosegnis marinus TaxID=3034023 RepID=A0ABD5ZTH7_9EURY
MRISPMSPPDDSASGRRPLERGFPIERISAIAERERRAKRHYRPIYTMHKWWARRLGSVGRAISLYGLITDADATTIHGEGRQITLDGPDESALAGAIDAVSATDPDALWPWYTSDITIDDVRVYDPFMGGGTFLTEAARFGADVIGTDLNPVAWFVTKTQLGASSVELDAFDAAFESVTAEVAEELTNHYQTPCPHASDDHTADVMHALWVKELDCVSCGDTVPLFGSPRRERSVRPQGRVSGPLPGL